MRAIVFALFLLLPLSNRATDFLYERDRSEEILEFSPGKMKLSISKGREAEVVLSPWITFSNPAKSDPDHGDFLMRIPIHQGVVDLRAYPKETRIFVETPHGLPVLILGNPLGERGPFWSSNAKVTVFIPPPQSPRTTIFPNWRFHSKGRTGYLEFDVFRFLNGDLISLAEKRQSEVRLPRPRPAPSVPRSPWRWPH